MKNEEKCSEAVKERRLRRRTMGAFLSTHRVRTGKTQTEVASVLGYKTSQFVSNWERGFSIPPFDTLAVLSDLYKIKPDDLINTLRELEVGLIELRLERLSMMIQEKKRSA